MKIFKTVEMEKCQTNFTCNDPHAPTPRKFDVGLLQINEIMGRFEIKLTYQNYLFYTIRSIDGTLQFCTCNTEYMSKYIF